MTTGDFGKVRNHLYLIENIGRGGEIRTHDPLRPRQVRYQAALRPDNCCSFDSKPLPRVKILPGMPKWSQNRPDRGKTVTKPHQLGLSVSKPGQPSVRLSIHVSGVPPLSRPKNFRLAAIFVQEVSCETVTRSRWSALPSSGGEPAVNALFPYCLNILPASWVHGGMRPFTATGY
jgi:hypothetical protein